MSRRKLSTTVYLTATQVIALKKIKERTGIPEAQIIREGIDAIARVYFNRLRHLGQFKEADEEALRKATHSVEKHLDDIFND